MQDQLTREHAAGRVFQAMREGPISWGPTYKFDRVRHPPQAGSCTLKHLAKSNPSMALVQTAA